MLGAKHIPYHLIDETILSKHGSINGKRLIVGECSYDFIIIPSLIYTMGKETEALLKEYISNGGKIIMLGDKPTYLEGKPFDYGYLKSNTSIDEIEASLDFVSKENPNIRISYRKDINNEPYFYIVNLGEETDLELSYKGYKTFSREDDNSGAILSNTIHFNKYESR